MLPRNWSLPPKYGLRRRESSPVDHRRQQRSQSVSGIEMSKELRILDRYELRHLRRMRTLNTCAFKVRTMLETKNNIVDNYQARFQKLANDPLKTGPEDFIRRRKEMFKRIVEGFECIVDDDVIASLHAMRVRENEFSDKLEIIRTLQILEIRNKKHDKF